MSSSVHLILFQRKIENNKMNKVFVFGVLFTLFNVNQCCPTVTYQKKAGLPNVTSISTGSISYNNFMSYGNNCGHNKYWNVGDSGFIVNGVDAYENEFPYLVTLQFNGEFCGGVIISP